MTSIDPSFERSVSANAYHDLYENLRTVNFGHFLAGQGLTDQNIRPVEQQIKRNSGEGTVHL